MTRLQEPVNLNGKVTPFEGNGRGFGYPTANIKVPTNLEEGVYFGYADLDEYKNYPALIFVGTPITVGATEHRVEAHLLDIKDQDYYDQTLGLNIEYFHRPNQHFDSIDALLKAMKNDEKNAREWFSSVKSKP